MGIFDSAGNFFKNIIPSKTYTVKPAVPATAPIPFNYSPTAPGTSNFGSTPATALPFPSVSPTAPLPSSSFASPVIPQITSAPKTMPLTPTAPSMPTGAPSTMPAMPSTNGGLKAPPGMEYDGKGNLVPIGSNPAVGSNASASSPAVPTVDPKVQEAYDSAMKAVQEALKIDPEALSTQEDLDKLLESTKKAYTNTEGQAIPMDFITGQLASIERRANDLAEPLEKKLARLQAQRTSSLEASKFSLEQAGKALDRETARVNKTTADAESARRFDVEQKNKQAEIDLSNKKFEEDKRQFGETYAQNERKIAADAAAKMGDPNQKANDALQGFDLVNKILGGNTNAIAGVRGISSFFPGTEAQTTATQAKQLNAMLSLENRQKLKGSGAISDFEARTLADAASSLGIDPSTGYSSLGNDAFKAELRRIKGIFANAAGLEASVLITDPRTGISKQGPLDRNGINSAISQGYTVEYQ